MKRLIVILVILALTLSCVACKAEDPENLFEMQPTETQVYTEHVTEPESQPETTPQIDIREEVPLSMPYQYGNMQKNLPSGDFMIYGEEILFLKHGDGRFTLYAVNKETGKVSTFCKDAACTHQTSKCAAANVSANLEQYDGKLYAMDNNWQIMELKNGKFEQIADGQVSQFWHAYGNMYALTQDGSLVVFENGSSKPRILIDEYSVYYSVVFGQYLYGSKPQTVIRVDLTAEEPEQEVIVQGSGYATIDGEHIYYVDEMTNHLYRCNMDGSGSELLLDQGVLPASINFDDEYLYFRLFSEDFYDGVDSLSHELYRMPKANPTEIEIIAEIPERIFQVFTVPGYEDIFVTVYEKTADRAVIYSVAKDGSSIELLEFPDF